MQNSRKYSFIPDIWTAHLKLNHFRKKLHMVSHWGRFPFLSIRVFQRIFIIFIWYVIKIEWGEVFLTLNGAIVQLPISVKVPLRDKYRLRHMMSKRSLLLHVMLRKGTSWYALDNIEYLLPPPHLEESKLLLQMASKMTVIHHPCKGYLKFVLP